MKLFETYNSDRNTIKFYGDDSIQFIELNNKPFKTYYNKDLARKAFNNMANSGL